MGKDDSTGKRKHRDKDPDRKHKKRSKHEDDDEARHRKHRKDKSKVTIVDDGDDQKLWVEKDIDMDGERARDISYFWFFHSILTS